LIDVHAFDDPIEPPERYPQAEQRKEVNLWWALVTSIRTVEMHDSIAPIVLPIDLQPELAAQLEHAILPFAEPRAAYGDHAALGSCPVPGASAHATTRLDQLDRMAAIPQPPSCRKTGKSRTHYAVICP
jgi:hypothetical protein